MYRRARMTAEDEATGLHEWIASATVVRGKLSGLTGRELHSASEIQARERNSDEHAMRLKIACLGEAERHAMAAAIPMGSVVAGYNAIQCLNRVEKADAGIAAAIRVSVLTRSPPVARILDLAKAVETVPRDVAAVEAMIGRLTLTGEPTRKTTAAPQGAARS